jgi:tetratricopeptide (TPR) repeat protein
MALFHSFYWSEAGRAFERIGQTDPNCAMAYWGQAMVLHGNPFIWPLSDQALAQGAALIEKAKARQPGTERERKYVAALEVLFSNPGEFDHKSRAAGYERAMRALAKEFPEDIEATIIAALATTANFDPEDKSFKKQLEAAALLEPLFQSHPDHPGVAHYMIHSFDYPAIAAQGLPAAKRYSKVAASTPHARHMPSHIFTRLGYWSDSIASNTVSAAMAAADQRGLSDRLHAMDYLAYAYLQSGRDADALVVAQSLQHVPGLNAASFAAAFASAAIPVRYALERGRWADAAGIALFPHAADLDWSKYPHAEAVNVYGVGLGRARVGDAAGARAQADRLRELRQTMIEAKLSYWALQADIQAQIVDAWAAWAAGDREQALESLRAAADREDATEKSAVTPGPLMPAREQLGEMLLAMEKPADALRAFEASVAKEPNRFRGLFGAARAAELAGEPVKAQDYYRRLVAIAGASQRAEIDRARKFLAKSS